MLSQSETERLARNFLEDVAKPMRLETPPGDVPMPIGLVVTPEPDRRFFSLLPGKRMAERSAGEGVFGPYGPISPMAILNESLAKWAQETGLAIAQLFFTSETWVAQRDLSGEDEEAERFFNDIPKRKYGDMEEDFKTNPASMVKEATTVFMYDFDEEVSQTMVSHIFRWEQDRVEYVDEPQVFGPDVFTLSQLIDQDPRTTASHMCAGILSHNRLVAHG